MIEVPVYKILTNKYDSSSDRFVKKNIGGSPTGKRVEAPQPAGTNM